MRCPWKWQKECQPSRPAGEPPVQWGLFGGGEAFRVGDPNGDVWWMFAEDGVALLIDELTDNDWRDLIVVS